MCEQFKELYLTIQLTKIENLRHYIISRVRKRHFINYFNVSKVLGKTVAKVYLKIKYSKIYIVILGGPSSSSSPSPAPADYSAAASKLSNSSAVWTKHGAHQPASFPAKSTWCSKDDFSVQQSVQQLSGQNGRPPDVGE